MGMLLRPVVNRCQHPHQFVISSAKSSATAAAAAATTDFIVDVFGVDAVEDTLPVQDRQ
jgi:flavin reductase (DIM6/NTAB) family NADH-FMN oxidoreductase RutF